MNGIQAIWKILIKSEENNIIYSSRIKKIYSKKYLMKILIFLGFSELWCRPEWLICTVLPLPPPSVRPSVKQDNSQRMDDDLTHKLSDIIKV